MLLPLNLLCYTTAQLDLTQTQKGAEMKKKNISLHKLSCFCHYRMPHNESLTLQNVSPLSRATTAEEASAAVQHLACNLRCNNYIFPTQNSSAQNFSSGQRARNHTEQSVSTEVGGAKTIRYSSLALFKGKRSLKVLYSIHSQPMLCLRVFAELEDQSQHDQLQLLFAC